LHTSKNNEASFTNLTETFFRELTLQVELSFLTLCVPYPGVTFKLVQRRTGHRGVRFFKHMPHISVITRECCS